VGITVRSGSAELTGAAVVKAAAVDDAGDAAVGAGWGATGAGTGAGAGSLVTGEVVSGGTVLAAGLGVGSDVAAPLGVSLVPTGPSRASVCTVGVPDPATPTIPEPPSDPSSVAPRAGEAKETTAKLPATRALMRGRTVWRITESPQSTSSTPPRGARVAQLRDRSCTSAGRAFG